MTDSTTVSAATPPTVTWPAVARTGCLEMMALATMMTPIA